MRDDVKRRRLRTTIPGGDTEEKLLFVFGVFGGFDDDIPVTVLPGSMKLRAPILAE